MHINKRLRNLGRDDRIISDRGREARHPFLEEHLVELLARLPLSSICDMRMKSGEGDKRVLRSIAAKLGLVGPSVRPKQAIQFGSRIAQIVNKQEFGSNKTAQARTAGAKPMTKSFAIDEEA